MFLRQQGQLGGQLGEHAPRSLHDREHLQRGDHRIAGGRVVEREQMARGLASEHTAGLTQHRKDVAVTDTRAAEINPERGERALEAVVGH